MTYAKTIQVNKMLKHNKMHEIAIDFFFKKTYSTIHFLLNKNAFL